MFLQDFLVPAVILFFCLLIVFYGSYLYRLPRWVYVIRVWSLQFQLKALAGLLQQLKALFIRRERAIITLRNRRKNINANDARFRGPIAAHVGPTTLYYPMTAVNDAECNERYEEALAFALDHPDITNIGITGPYGSGKTSMIKTFQHRFPEYAYINVSLANFKNPEGAPAAEAIVKSAVRTDKPQQSDWELIQDIERSILQQIFYHVERHTIPFSRYRRIRSYSKAQLTQLSVGIVAYLISWLVLFYNSWCHYLMIPRFFDQFAHSNWTQGFAAAAILALSGWLIYRLVKTYTKWRITKLNLSAAEVEIGTHSDVLNNSLDELLYFFSATPYNVLVIEDLDRFHCEDVFVKLREINVMINQSKSVNRKISFVYALRDDMFQANDHRTKFFDFLIPILPRTNAVNAMSRLLELFERAGMANRIDRQLLGEIGLYIHDTRKHNNILNEFLLYHRILDPNRIAPNNLLAMIVYKNILPLDFTKLQINEGEMYQALNSREQLFTKSRQHLSSKKEVVENKLNALEREWIATEEELRGVYVSAACRLAQSNTIRFSNGSRYDLHYLLTDIGFRELRIHLLPIVENNITQNLSFSDLEERVSPLSFNERLERIRKNQQLDKINLTKELAQQNAKLHWLSYANLATLLNYYGTEDLPTVIQDQTLLVTFLRNGYINEDYRDLLSIFVPGELSATDRQYLDIVKGRRPEMWKLKLTNLERVVERLRLEDFQSPSIRNIEMLHYLENNVPQTSRLIDAFLEHLTANLPSTWSFVKEYCRQNDHRFFLIPALAEKMPDMWSAIETSESHNGQLRFFSWIVECVSKESLKKINIDDRLAQFAAKVPFLLIPDRFKIATKKVTEFLSACNVKLNLAAHRYKPDQAVFYAIYEGCHFRLTLNMVDFIISHRLPGTELSKFHQAHFTNLDKPELKKLKEYIIQELPLYITDVYLNLPNPITEDKLAMVELLGACSLRDIKPIPLIEKVDFVVDDIEDIPEELWESIFSNNRIERKWENVIFYFTSESKKTQLSRQVPVSEEIIQWVNELPIMPITVTPDFILSLDVVQEVIITLLLSDNLELSAFQYMVDVFNPILQSSDLNDLYSDQLQYILEKDAVEFTSKSVEIGLIINENATFDWISRHYEEFVVFASNLSWQPDEIKSILDRLKSITIHQESKLLNLLSFNDLVKYITEYKIVHSISIVHLTHKIQPEELDLLLGKHLPSNLAISILANSISNYSYDKLLAALNQLGDDYRKLAKRRGKTVKSNPFMLKLLESLQSANWIIAEYEPKNVEVNITWCPI